MELKDIILSVVAVVVGALLAGALLPSAVNEVHKGGANNTWTNSSAVGATSPLPTVSAIWTNGIVVMVALSGTSVFIYLVLRALE